MISKLIILNGIEGHKFEVGKEYVFSDVNTTVKEISIVNHGYNVLFQDNKSVDVITNNVLVFNTK